MEMIDHTSPELTLFFTLYGGAAVTAVILCLYLLLRRGNVFAPNITTPMRLRRWAAAFFAVVALSHVWWLLFYIYSWEEHSMSYFIVCLLDCVTMPVTIFGTLLSMLQDRRRPLLPFVIAMIPIVILGVLQMLLPDIDLIVPGFVYMLALYMVFTLYMAIAIKQYGRWLRDNYADLEHKEVWQSLALLIVLFFLFFALEFVFESMFLVYFVRLIYFLLFAFLLWRVETLPQLEVMSKFQEDCMPALETQNEAVSPTQKTHEIPSNIGQLLEKYCVETQLYLQHDLTLAQLAAAITTNRSYLSRYFSNQGTTYNAYINNLRIDHFVALYREAVATQSPFTFQQLANDSGYRSYSTFSLAFKQRMGQSVTAWMRRNPAT